MIRQALARQVHQCALSVGVVGLGLVALGPLTALVRGALDVTRERKLPLGEMPACLAITLLGVVVLEEYIVFMLIGRRRLWPLMAAMTVQVMCWALVAVVARHRGAVEVNAAAIPTCLLVYLLSKPIAVFLRPKQTCAARLRRVVRELRTGLLRLASTGVALLVVLYVYVTVFTHLDMTREVLLMGVAMPLLQALCMSALARLMGRMESNISAAVNRVPASSLVQPEAGSATGGAAAGGDGAADANRGAGLAFLMVMSAEIVYSAGAFAALGLAESDKTFYLSSVSMLVIEVVQVALHIKARRVVSRVVNEATGKTCTSSDARLLQWLLHQELGEKVGLLVAVGFLAIDKALGRDIPAMQALDATRLAQRGLAMALMEVLGDFAKDLVAQYMGLLRSQETPVRVSLSRAGVMVAMLMCVNAGFLVQSGLAVGT